MATNTVTTEQVREAIEQLAAMVAAGSISPQTVADILEMMRNLNDQERLKVIETSESYIAEIENTGIPAEKVGYGNGSAKEVLDLINGTSDIIEDTITQNSGFFIRFDGNKSESENFFYSQPIRAYAGCEYTLKAKGYSTNVAMISECASDGTNVVPKVISVDSTLREYKYTPSADCYLIVSAKNEGTPTLEHYVHEGKGLVGDVSALQGNVSTLQGDMASVQNDVNSVNSIVNGTSETVQDTITPVSGKFINASGGISTNEAFLYSQPILARAGSEYTFTAKGYNTNVAMISECASDGTNIVPKVISVDSTLREYKYTPSANCYLIVCCKNEGTPTLSHYVDGGAGLVGDVSELQENVSSLQGDVNTLGGSVSEMQGEVDSVSEAINGVFEVISDTITQNNGYFLRFDGEIISSENFFYSQPIQAVGGCEYTFEAKGYGVNVAMISECASDGTNIVPKVVSVDSTVRKYSYTPSANCYLIVSGNKTATHTLSHKIISQEGILGILGELEKSVNGNLYKINDLTLSIFEKVGIVGDSFASGVIYLNNSGNDGGNTFRSLSWGKILSRMRGFTCQLFSRGGYTTHSFIEDTDYGLSTLLAAEPQQLYILALGINDGGSGANGVPVGTISDIGTENNTYYRNYGYIISAIQQHAPNAKIVLSTTAKNPNSGKTYADYNAAVVALAQYYNIVYIDQMSDKFFSSAPYINMISNHPVAVSYGGMALAIERLICKSFVSDYEYWRTYRG